MGDGEALSPVSQLKFSCPTLPCWRQDQRSEEHSRPPDMARAKLGEQEAEPDELRLD